jgi:hypothetical protein
MSFSSNTVMGMTSARLIIRSSGQPDQEVRLAGGASIGRASDNSIRVDVDGVSRYHAIIEQKADGFWLSDLGSRNGTTVDGVAVGAITRLEDGNLILLGGVTTLGFHADAAVQPGRGASTQKQTADDPGHVPEASQSAGGRSSGATALKVGLAIAGVVVVVFIVARLVLPMTSGTSGGSRPPTPPAQGTPTGDAQRASGSPGGVANRAPVQQPDVATRPLDITQPEPAVTDPEAEPGIREVRSMADGLARQLSGRGGWLFRGEFVDRVIRVIPEYKGRVLSDARPYSHDIDVRFHDEALEPLFGLILAMSLSKLMAQRCRNMALSLNALKPTAT